MEQKHKTDSGCDKYDGSDDGAVARNVIFVLPDGFGSAARGAYRAFDTDGTAPSWEDGLKGLVATSPATGPVTDSAASATAYATGVKTNNGAVGVDVDGNELVSLLDIASDAGKATGIISTAMITDASPAAFASSNVDRGNHAEIAQEYIDNDDLDVILGGGRVAFDVDGDGDGMTTIEEAQAAGFDYATTAGEMEAAGGDRLLGLFTDEDMSAPIGNGEIGARPEGEPSLTEMTQVALDRLSADEDGFFLFIEEEGTDTYNHANDAAAGLHSAKSYDDVLQMAKDYAEANPDTLVISVADHETAGMTLEFGEDASPEIFRGFEATVTDMLTAVNEAVAGLGEDASALDTVEAVNATVAGLTGGAVELGVAEIAGLLTSATPEDAYASLAEILSARGGIDYSTSGHTAVDVPIYAFGAGADLKGGLIDNTEVAEWVAEAMGVELPEAQQDYADMLIA